MGYEKFVGNDEKRCAVCMAMLDANVFLFSRKGENARLCQGCWDKEDVTSESTQRSEDPCFGCGHYVRDETMLPQCCAPPAVYYMCPKARN